MAVLQGKPYFERLSNYLVSQLVELSCDSLSYVTRALDAMERGSPITQSPGAFSKKGGLAGYGHVHFKRQDWAAGNLAALHGKPPSQRMDVTLDQIVRSLLATGQGYEGVKAEAERFGNRISTQASGDWVLYRNGPRGVEYLAIHEHTKRGSPEELRLKTLLDQIAAQADLE
ncbi:hypothetical protein G7013_06260 [Pseudomonas viridiflava]|uniref:hypothetical protein n=1 Tax=Pseudomonas viridiflava TaxID=33069 RepID=UPI0015E37EC9|nr:hypothetical protein [Pseudomonas viridiflava]MBA1229247.1 hypothetical protein [Pseudomonas viridiflava]